MGLGEMGLGELGQNPLTLTLAYSTDLISVWCDGVELINEDYCWRVLLRGVKRNS